MMIREPERGYVPGRANGAQDKVYGAYLQRLDPRNNPDVQEALSATDDVRFREFFDRIMLPQYRKISLATVAKACNITLAEFNKWWQREATQRAIAEAQMASIHIAKDMAQDALSQEAVCSRCDGLGFVAAPIGLPGEIPGYRCIEEPTEDEPAKYIRDCPNCKATKVIRRPGDSHARDRILEMSGHLKKGPAIMINQNFGGMSHGSAVSDLDKAMNLDAVDVTGEEVRGDS